MWCCLSLDDRVPSDGARWRVGPNRPAPGQRSLAISRATVAQGNVPSVASAQREQLERRAADLAEHLLLALEAGGLGTFRWDAATGLVEMDEHVRRLFGLEPEGLRESLDEALERVHPDDRSEAKQIIEESLASGRAHSLEYRTVWPDGSVHWIHSAAQVILDAGGRPTGAIGCSSDVTEAALAEQERERLTLQAIAAAERERVHRERLEFLSRISDAVSSATNRRELMVNVAKAAVPRLGDWCSLYVLPPGGGVVPEIEIAHVDPAMVAYAWELQERFPYDPDASSGMPRVIRDGATEFFRALDEEALAALDAPDDALDIVRDLGLWSSIAVPLVKKGRVLGGLQLIMTKSRRDYSEQDLLLVEVVASRVAASLENLRLSEEQRAIASTLQASLLPQDLPGIPGVDVAVRYWASGENVEVGGDFYDLFRVADGRYGVVIGDVCGKGPSAAALTSMARHTIAASAWHGDDPPAVLSNLNRVMLERRVESFCTAVYGTLELAGGGFAFTFACGGHPLPVVAHADGRAAALGAAGSLIGVLDRIAVTATTVELDPGDVVILYTDGATDVAPPYAIATEDFTRLVASAVLESSSASQIADHLHRRLSAVQPIADRTDDIALLVLRIDRPAAA